MNNLPSDCLFTISTFLDTRDACTLECVNSLLKDVVHTRYFEFMYNRLFKHSRKSRLTILSKAFKHARWDIRKYTGPRVKYALLGALMCGHCSIPVPMHAKMGKLLPKYTCPYSQCLLCTKILPSKTNGDIQWTCSSGCVKQRCFLCKCPIFANHAIIVKRHTTDQKRCVCLDCTCDLENLDFEPCDNTLSVNFISQNIT
jgi:hypothetical protein